MQTNYHNMQFCVIKNKVWAELERQCNNGREKKTGVIKHFAYMYKLAQRGRNISKELVNIWAKN